MASIRSVDPQRLVKAVAQRMESEKLVSPPEWSSFVKTGAHALRPPDAKNWWFARSAAVLRKVAVWQPVGVGKLRSWFGGKKRRGVRPEHHYRAGGKIIRTVLQQLESAGLVKKAGKGRVVTPKGQQFLDKSAAVVSRMPVEERKFKLRFIKSAAKRPTAPQHKKPAEAKPAAPKAAKEKPKAEAAKAKE
jgi:small subunit ribosomal protein S19e